MAKDTVMNFLRERKKAAEAHADERADWEAALKDLSTRIQGWLKQPIDEGLLKVEEELRPASDPVLGKYEALCLDLLAPDGERIIVRPLDYDAKSGLFRAFMMTATHSVMLAWQRKTGEWFIAFDEDNPDFKPLNGRSLTKAFKLVLGA